MKSWETFDVRKYIQDKSLCNLLEQKDTFNARALVKKFISFVQLDIAPPNAKTAIIAPSGSGKSFFLGLLYCKLCCEEKSVHFIDILDYISDDTQVCIDKIEKLADKECETVTIIIDNLDKHSSGFIYSFIYLLHRLSIKENFFFVLAYDYTMLLDKLSQQNHTRNEIEHFLQSYIDIEFYLGGRIPLEYLYKIIDDNLKEFFIEYFKGFDKIEQKELLISVKTFMLNFYNIKQLSIKQLNSAINKLKYLMINGDYGSLDVKCLFNLLMLKVVDKSIYYNLLIDSIDNKDKTMEILLDGELETEYMNFSQTTGSSIGLKQSYINLIKNIELVYE